MFLKTAFYYILSFYGRPHNPTFKQGFLSDFLKIYLKKCHHLMGVSVNLCDFPLRNPLLLLGQFLDAGWQTYALFLAKFCIYFEWYYKHVAFFF